MSRRLTRRQQKQLDLNILLQPKQTELLDLVEGQDATTIGYGGARGGGKSAAARRIMVLRRIVTHPGTAGMIFRRVYDDLKRNHIDKFFEEFPQFFPYYRATDHEIIFPATREGVPPSRIVFGYAETEGEVKRKFHGPEYADIFVDQAEQLSENELKIMKTACRWPAILHRQCKFVLFFNPGGQGIAYLKRIFKDREYRDREKAGDYAFIQAYGWDNVEWVRSALVEDGVDEEAFYAWSDDQRFQYFINRSQYGQELDSLPEALRIGYLMGDFEAFAGQYFDLWNPVLHVRRPEELGIQPWHPKWISIDWGFSHSSAVYWHAQDEHVTKTYREFVGQGLGPVALANKVVSLCRLEREREKIDAIYLSPDAFAKRTTEDSIAQQLKDEFLKAQMPSPRRADDHRESGWMLMYDMLKYGRWVVSRECPKLIGNIPLFSRDDKNLEDCVKFDGDDPGDSARYGLKSRFASKEPPHDVQFQTEMRRLEMVNDGHDDGWVNTMKHMGHLRFENAWKRKHKPVRVIRRAPR